MELEYLKYQRLQTNNLSEKRINHSKTHLFNQIDKLYKETHKLSYASRERYARSTKNLAVFLAKNYGLQNINNLDKKHVYQYVEYLIDEDYKVSSIKNMLSGIRFTHSLFNNPKMEDFPTNKSFDLDRRIAELEKTRAFSPAEVQRFEQVCKDLNRDDVLMASRLARTLGLRINEVTVLKKDKLESALRNGYLELKRGDGTKGGRPRNIPLTKESRSLIEQLNSQVGRGEYVIRGEQTGQRHTVKKSITNFMYNHRDKYQDKEISMVKVTIDGKEIEVERTIRFHSFRYSYAQERYKECINQGQSKLQAEYTVSEYLGHSRPDITRRYL